MRNKETINRALQMVLIIICICQGLFICYINLFQLKYHCGADMAGAYYTAIEMWNQKSLLLDNFVYTTSLVIDSNVPLAALLYGVTSDIFLAFGIANIIMGAVLVLSFILILRIIKVSKLSKIISLNMLMTLHFCIPYYILNSLDYGDMTFTSFGAYTFKCIIMLLTIYTVISLGEDKHDVKTLVIACISVALTGITAFSSSFWNLAMVIAPLCAYCFFGYLFKKERNLLEFLKRKQTIYIILLAVISVLAILCQKKLFLYQSKGLSANYVTAGFFWNNIGSIFAGILNLESAYPPNNTAIGLLSLEGMYYLVNLVLMVIEVVGIGYVLINKKLRERIYNKVFFCVALFEFVIFCVIDLSYYMGEPVYQYRYLINIHLIFILISSQYIDYIIKKQGMIAIIAVMILIYYSNINADCCYIASKGNYDIAAGYVDDMSQYDDKVVYMLDEEMVPDVRGVVTGNISPVWYDAYMMRLIDDRHIYKVIKNGTTYNHWGDTTRLDSIEEYKGPIIVFVPRGRDDLLPEEMKSDAIRIHDNERYTIYEIKENKHQFQFAIIQL